jgi:acetyl esterase/lipase
MPIATVTLLALLVLLASRALAEDPKPQLLWPDGAPLAKGHAAADQPAITVHLPAADKASGAAVVICPGGGYAALMMSYEGHDVARWLNEAGIAGIVLQYRVAPYRQPASLLDAQRAIRTVRSNAKAWRIDPAKIGIMGFSAGGHLAATAETHFEAGDPQAADAIDRLSSRPDFALLVYPVITMGAKTHAGTRENLLGKSPTPADIEMFSNEKHVTAQTPPTFLAHSVTDHVVSVENSRLFFKALQDHEIPAEYFELPTGDHGLGCGKGPEWTAWQAKCMAWLKARQLTSAPETAGTAPAGGVHGTN